MKYTAGTHTHIPKSDTMGSIQHCRFIRCVCTRVCVCWTLAHVVAAVFGNHFMETHQINTHTRINHTQTNLYSVQSCPRFAWQCFVPSRSLFVVMVIVAPLSRNKKNVCTSHRVTVRSRLMEYLHTPFFLFLVFLGIPEIWWSGKKHVERNSFVFFLRETGQI